MTDFNQKTHDTDVGSHGGQSRQMMELFETGKHISVDIFSDEYLDKINAIQLPNTKIKVFVNVNIKFTNSTNIKVTSLTNVYTPSSDESLSSLVRCFVR